mgnify:CR=1 FL=1
MQMSQQDLNGIDFYRYPPIGPEDWEYAYACARVRLLRGHMLGHGVFVDMANADSFAAATELLSGSEYAIESGSDDAQIDNMLVERRSAARAVCAEIMYDNYMVRMMRVREDVVNMRLATRRPVTDKPLGLDYSNEGTVAEIGRASCRERV